MPKTRWDLKIDPALAMAADLEAKRLGVTRTAFVERALRYAIEPGGGPVAPAPFPRPSSLRASSAASERALSEANGTLEGEQAGPGPSSPSDRGVRSAAPAEPPRPTFARSGRHVPGPDVSNIRSSQQARGHVKPFPKKDGGR